MHLAAERFEQGRHDVFACCCDAASYHDKTVCQGYSGSHCVACHFTHLGECLLRGFYVSFLPALGYVENILRFEIVVLMSGSFSVNSLYSSYCNSVLHYHSCELLMRQAECLHA